MKPADPKKVALYGYKKLMKNIEKKGKLQEVSQEIYWKEYR